ncbi:hypothetical protein [Cylindrospermopsis raciborskii]|uniref:hypothetical protein n=1 Tax=Cylindrospermopsis raciborskii TaxID=77022 RepID=UPI002154FA6D|nr:hypothetical protein [Cylindrospermopsis raciborskii]
MTKIYTKDFKINCVPKRRTWQNIAQEIMKLPLPGIPIRVILTSAQDDTLSFECSFIAIEKN